MGSMYKTETGEPFKKNVGENLKDAIFKYNPIGSVIDYDQDAKLKQKEVKYKQFSYSKATIYLFIIWFLSIKQ